MFRSVRFLLIFLLAPVVVFASAVPAEAVTYYGNTGSAKVYMDNQDVKPYADGECRVTAAYGNSLTQGPGIPAGTGSLFVKGQVDCDGQWGSVWGVQLPTASASTWVKFKGTNLANGESCLLAGFTPNDKIPGNDGPQPFTTASVGVTASLTSGCDVGEVCIEADYSLDMSGWNDPDYSYNGECTTIDLGDIPRGPNVKDNSTCANGTPKVLTDTKIDGAVGTIWEGYESHSETVSFSGTPPTNNTTTGGWSITYFAWNGTGTALTTTGSIPSQYSLSSTQSNKLVWSDANTLKSAWVLMEDLPKHKLSSSQDTAVGAMVSFGGAGTAGQTVEASCQFWFGPQIPGKNEPWGTVQDGETPLPSTTEPDTTPPPSTNSDCDFKVTDPGSWLSGGMCAVVGLLQGIWGTLQDMLNALQGLAAAIAGAIGDAIAAIVSPILDGIRALFLPSDGALEAAFDEVSASFDGTAPGQWIGAFSGQVLTASQSGCAGPTIAFHTDMADIDMQPFNACSGVMATVAGICKLVLSAGLVLGGGMACLRALGSGFGWNPSVGGKV